MKTVVKNRAPYLIVLLIGCFVLFLVWAAYQASTRGSGITDRDYYSKGLKYNSTLIERKAASALGWNLTFSLDDRSLRIRLFDKQQRPVADGEATLYLYRPEASAPLAFPVPETDPGTYRLALPEDLRGEHRARLDFHRNGARINRNLLLNL